MINGKSRSYYRYLKKKHNRYHDFNDVADKIKDKKLNFFNIIRAKRLANFDHFPKARQGKQESSYMNKKLYECLQAQVAEYCEYLLVE